MNEELLYAVKPVLSAILFNTHSGIKIKFRIENTSLFYGLDSEIFCSIDLLFLLQE